LRRKSRRAAEKIFYGGSLDVRLRIFSRGKSLDVRLKIFSCGESLDVRLKKFFTAKVSTCG